MYDGFGPFGGAEAAFPGEHTMALTAKQKREVREAALRNQQNPEVAVANAAALADPGLVRAAAGPISTPQSAGAKVIVALKVGIPHLDIQCCKIVEKFEQTMSGGRTIKEAQRIGKIVRLRGTAYPRGTPPEGFPEKPLIVGGAALNFGIDKDFWDTWVEQNARNPLVMNGMIFAYENMDMVQGRALEEQANRSGLEPLNPRGDPRIPKSSHPDVSDVETEDSRKAKMARAIGNA